MDKKETSDLSIDRKECPRCKAVWLNGQHIWSGTGKPGDPETLSNLVCGLVEDPKCINPSHKKGHIYGEKDTWKKRSKFIDSKIKGDCHATWSNDSL
jgi:hypothetical protein